MRLGEGYPSPSSGKTHESLNTAPGPESSPVLFCCSLRNTYLEALDCNLRRTLSCDGSLGEDTRQSLRPETTTKLRRHPSAQIQHASAVKQPQPRYPAVLSTASARLAALPNSAANPPVKAEEQALLTAPWALTEGVVLPLVLGYFSEHMKSDFSRLKAKNRTEHLKQQNNKFYLSFTGKEQSPQESPLGKISAAAACSHAAALCWGTDLSQLQAH